ncbi:hypothetical protein DFJ58DRAFT_727445 [Suillus subalutaceus]|uniref:uncharacterized protein n=1 Tax=Suillus subalutaceus TaxID=48586 RepID=UPI001B87DAF6|nr:uncharacterized protein DFJ58DRAFT_727445 [Suillus subalutaceus]KAG1855635.1 hypothetical protein DFJ58DRAFT_727445 [Suillus subalutaceus]
MRLQYAKLKVEHGWVRGLRPVVPTKTVPLLSTNPLPPTAPVLEPPEPVVVDEVSQQVINNQAPPIDTSRGHTSPHDSPVKLTTTPVQNSFTDTTSKSASHTLQTLPEKAALSGTDSETVAPPYSPLDFSDPVAMAPSHSQTPTQIQTHIQSQPYNPYMPLNRQFSQPQPNPFMPQPLPQYSFTQSYHATSLQNQSNPQISHSQPSANSQPSFGNGNGNGSGPLTYDSFWSTHASAGSLYRTHGGFTASATPTGHVAMITPGGHAAVMTAEGVYVGTAGYTGRVSG